MNGLSSQVTFTPSLAPQEKKINWKTKQTCTNQQDVPATSAAGEHTIFSDSGARDLQKLMWRRWSYLRASSESPLTLNTECKHVGGQRSGGLLSSWREGVLFLSPDPTTSVCRWFHEWFGAFQGHCDLMGQGVDSWTVKLWEFCDCLLDHGSENVVVSG